VLGSASTGAASDLSGATELAVKMVKDWGLSSRLGPIGYGGDDGASPGGYQSQQSRPYAEATQQIIDQEVSRMLSEAETRASHLLEKNRLSLDAVVALLLERETISGTDLAAAVNSIRSDTELHPALAGL
jgi:cell division protease FtsH